MDKSDYIINVVFGLDGEIAEPRVLSFQLKPDIATRKILTLPQHGQGFVMTFSFTYLHFILI